MLRLKPRDLDFSTNSLSRYNTTFLLFDIANASEGMRREEQSNKSVLNKTNTDCVLRKRRNFVIIAGIVIILIVVGLYIEIFKTPEIYSLRRTEYGVCIHIYQFDPSVTIQLIKQLNAKWIRIDWIPNEMDSFVRIMKDNDVKILAILDHNTVKLEDFKRFEWQVTIENIMATEAAKEVYAWEIWNEPNADQFFLGYMNGTPQNYFDMLKDAYQIIKTESPDATIVAAGLSPSNEVSYFWKDWLRDFAALSLQNYFDFQGVHIYDDIDTNLKIISETKEIIDKDVWITEIGKPSGPSNQGYSPEDQSSFLKSNFQMLIDMRIPIFWYQLKDEIGASDPKENYFGLFDAQDNPKPASEAFNEFASKT